MGETAVTLEKINRSRHMASVLCDPPKERVRPTCFGVDRGGARTLGSGGSVDSPVELSLPQSHGPGGTALTGNAIVVRCSEQVCIGRRNGLWRRCCTQRSRLLHLDPKLVQLCCCFPKMTTFCPIWASTTSLHWVQFSWRTQGSAPLRPS